jgi:PAS domain S-box-containing protein
MQIELAVLCALLAIFSAVLLWDRRRSRRRMADSVAEAEGDAKEQNSRRRFLEAILGSIGDPIFVKDDDHRYTYVNEAKCRLSGIEEGDILGKTGYDVAFPVKEQVDVFVRRDQFVLETGREDLNEEELTDAEGVVHTVLTKKSLYVDDSGRRCVVGVIRDITGRKRAEEAIKRGQTAYLAEAQRLSLTGSFGWTPSTEEIHWSDESFRIFALDPAVKPTIELVLERVHPEDRELVRQAIRATSRGERDFDVTHRIVLPDGSIKYVHVLSHAVKDSAGNREVAGAIADVTERTLHEQVLRQNDERYRFVFEHLPIALWRITSDVVPDLFENLRSRGDSAQDNPTYLRAWETAVSEISVLLRLVRHTPSTRTDANCD